MSSEDRPSIDRVREVRVIRALYQQESLSQAMEFTKSTSTVAASPATPRTYQNTGVQTLPPANGDVFQLIYGRERRELSHNDYARSMGTAGIGRLTNDPCMNPYELVHGAAYPAPTIVTKEAYTDSGFQTASHGTRKVALARAKVKASIMVNKFRKAASEAGYVVCVESRDEMIVHSERLSNAVRLDKQGNLLEGDVKSKSLPNIHGALIHGKPSEATAPQKMSRQHAEHLLKQSRYVEHGVQTSQAPYPSPLQSPCMLSGEGTTRLRNPATTIPALAPAATEQVPIATSGTDNEYGSGESATDEFVVFDAGAGHVAGSGTKASPGKRKASREDTDDRSCKKYKSSAQAIPRSPSACLAPLAITPPNKPQQICNSLPLTPDSDLKASPRTPRTPCVRSDDTSQNGTLNNTHSSATSKNFSKENSTNSTDTSRARGSKPQRHVLRDHSANDEDGIVSAGACKPSEARNDNGTRRAVKKTVSSLPTHQTPKPTVPLAVVAMDPAGSDAKVTDPVLRRYKRTFEQISGESVDGKQDTIRARKIVTDDCYRNASTRQEYSPREAGDDFSDPTAAPEAHSQKSTPCMAKATDRTESGRVKKAPRSRTPRTARPPMAPYVPPAKRLRDRNELEAEKEKRR